MKILITGISGFAASHLARELVDEGHEVHGTVRMRNDLSKLKGMEVETYLMEITDYISVENVLREVQPDEIYHLAAQSYVKLSWDAPLETYRINVEGTLNIFEAMRKLELDVPILVTSTSETYGEIDGDINEETRQEPITHYGISKYAQDMIARLYHRSYGMKVIVTRAFNITGPGRADMFVDSSFAKQIAEIEQGKRDKISHGNLETARDFIDVRDVVKGYIMALRSERWGEVFCFGSGEPVKIQKILDILVSLSREDIKTERDPKRFRPTDTKSMKANTKKANELGWWQTISLKKSLEDLLNYWRI